MDDSMDDVYIGVNYWGELLEGQADEEIAGEGDAKDGGEGGNEALFLTVSAGKKVVLGARVPMTGKGGGGCLFSYLLCWQIVSSI